MSLLDRQSTFIWWTINTMSSLDRQSTFTWWTINIMSSLDRQSTFTWWTINTMSSLDSQWTFTWWTINTMSSLDGPPVQCLQTQRKRRSAEDINASDDEHHSCLQHFCTPRSCMSSCKPQTRPTGGRYIREIGKKVQIRLRNAAGFVCRCFCAVCGATEKKLTLARSVCAVCRAKENADFSKVSLCCMSNNGKCWPELCVSVRYVCFRPFESSRPGLQPRRSGSIRAIGSSNGLSDRAKWNGCIGVERRPLTWGRPWAFTGMESVLAQRSPLVFLPSYRGHNSHKTR